MNNEVHWEGINLYDDEYRVGRVVIDKPSHWMADPFWSEDPKFFALQEEAKSWLVAVYQMGEHKCRIQKVKSKTN